MVFRITFGSRCLVYLSPQEWNHYYWLLSIPGILESGSKTNILDVGALCFAVIAPIKVSVPSCVISNSWSFSEDRNPLLHSVNKVLGIVLYFLQEAWREWLWCSCRNIDQHNGENSMFPCTSSACQDVGGLNGNWPRIHGAGGWPAISGSYLVFAWGGCHHVRWGWGQYGGRSGPLFG